MFQKEELKFIAIHIKYRQNQLNKYEQENHLKFENHSIEAVNRSSFDLTFYKKPLKRRNAIVPLFQVQGDHKQLVKFDEIQEKTQNEALLEPCKQTIEAYSLDTLKLEQENLFKNQPIIYQRHKFTSAQYEQAKDQIIYLFRKTFNSSYLTIFTALDILKRYLTNTQNLQPEDLKYLAFSSIYMASKLVDVYCISIEDFYVEFCNEEYGIHDILQKEKNICQILNYDLIKPNPYNYFYRMFYSLNLTQEKEKIFEKGITYLMITIILEELQFLNDFMKALASLLIVALEYDGSGLQQRVLSQADHQYLNINQIDEAIELVQKHQSRVFQMQFKSTFMKY
ncbi:G2/mitotic-specific cyclin [Paramecium bursaria]